MTQLPTCFCLVIRKKSPPVIKALCIEFYGRAAVAVVLQDADAKIGKMFGVTTRPTLLYITDEDSLESEVFKREFKKPQLDMFFSRAVMAHRAATGSKVRELTSARLINGDCAPNDSQFCLLLFELSGAAVENRFSDMEIGDQLRKKQRAALKEVAQSLKRDPVKVFFVRDEKFAQAFGDAQSSSVVLFRPKRKRYKVFEGDASDASELRSFVEGALGGSMLPTQTKSTPTFGRSEL